MILNADVIIHIAGIPLLGVNLKACLDGMEIWHLAGLG
ncbi:MAG: gas vesicle protein GvpJ [Candidatus Cloacimonadia bacterium]